MSAETVASLSPFKTRVTWKKASVPLVTIACSGGDGHSRGEAERGGGEAEHPGERRRGGGEGGEVHPGPAGPRHGQLTPDAFIPQLFWLLCSGEY